MLHSFSRKENFMTMLVLNPFIQSLRRKISTIINTLISKLPVGQYLNISNPGITEKDSWFH